jgi:hypothetical protein
MALFTGRSRADYPRVHMPKAATGDGPWGEAIEYWLNRKNWRQSDLLREIHNLNAHAKTSKNTISSAARGLDVSTRVLRVIAGALKAPLDSVLVSPERKLANEDRRRLAIEISEQVLRTIEGGAGPSGPPPLSVDESVDAMRAAIREEEARAAAPTEELAPGRKRTLKKKPRKR